MKPQLSLKSTLIFSTFLAVLLNMWQFATTYAQRQTAFAPAWAQATPIAAPAPAKVVRAGIATPNPSTPTSTAAANTTTPTAPTTDPVADATTRLTAAGLKPDYAALYLRVQGQTNTPWQLLAAVHKIETGQSGTTSITSYAGAVGPMQFMPATFNHYALDGDGDGTKNIRDLEDAMLTAGHYLAAGGADKGNYTTALYHYNHSYTYVSQVLTIAHRLGLQGS